MEDKQYVLSAFTNNPHNSYIIVDDFLVDTGSQVTIVPKSCATEIKHESLLPKLFAANGSKIKTH